ncbi:hypothetical protein Gotur_007971, partial [Gossypium turneri]
VFRIATSEQCRIFYCGIWILWTSRNYLVHERKIVSGKEISDWTISYVKELEGIEKKSLSEREILISGNPLMNLSLRLTLMGPMTPSMQDLGIHMGAKCVIIEGDSLTTIKKANSDSEDKSEIGAITKNIQQYKKNFQQIIFRHISRSANSLAHHLAKEILKKGEDNNLSDESRISYARQKREEDNEPQIEGEFGWTVRLPAVSVKIAVAVRLDIVAIL